MAKLRREIDAKEQRITAAWKMIFQPLPCRQSKQGDSSCTEYDKRKFPSWAKDLNERIEVFVELVTELGLEEFLSFLSWRHLHEQIVVQLMNESKTDRLKTIKKSVTTYGLQSWLMAFNDEALLNSLLPWLFWQSNDSWQDRYFSYLRSCWDEKRLAARITSQRRHTCFLRSAKQWNLLMAEYNQCNANTQKTLLKQLPDSNQDCTGERSEPKRYHGYRDSDGQFIDSPPIDGMEPRDPLLGQAQVEFLNYVSGMAPTPKSYAMAWYKAGYPAGNCPPIEDREFQSRAKNLEFARKLVAGVPEPDDSLESITEPFEPDSADELGDDATAEKPYDDLTREEKALAILASQPDINKAEIARRLGIDVRSLGGDRMPTFNKAWQFSRAKDGIPGLEDADGTIDGIHYDKEPDT